MYVSESVSRGLELSAAELQLHLRDPLVELARFSLEWSWVLDVAVDVNGFHGVRVDTTAGAGLVRRIGERGVIAMGAVWLVVLVTMVTEERSRPVAAARCV